MKSQQIQTMKKEIQLNKKASKVGVKKCLDHSFDSLDYSLQLSEISVDQYDESFFLLDPQLPVCSKESIDLSDLTPSSALTVTKHVVDENSAVQCQSVETENSSDKVCIVSVEVDTLVKNLKKAQTQVKNSIQIDLLSSKLVDKLIDVVIEDFICPSDNYDRFESLFAMKFGVLISSFLLVLLGAVACFLFSGEQSSYTGPVPT